MSSPWGGSHNFARRHNAAAVLAEGRVQAVYRKMFLPNYGVFDEQRYSSRAPSRR